jgi:hypothetical protein
MTIFFTVYMIKLNAINDKKMKAPLAKLSESKK